MKDTVFFLAKCRNAVKDYAPEVRAELYEAIIDYETTGTIPEMSSVVKMAFNFIKDEIDALNDVKQKRSEAGKAGSDKRWNESQVMENDSKQWQSIVKDNKPLQTEICHKNQSQVMANDSKPLQTEICHKNESQVMANDSKPWQVIANDSKPLQTEICHKNESKSIANDGKKWQKNGEILIDINNNNYKEIDKEKINKKERDSSCCSCLKKEDSKGEKFQKPTIEEISSYVAEKNFHIDAEKFFNYYETIGWKVGKNPMRNWHSAVATWETNEKNKTGGGVTNSSPLPDKKNLYGLSQQQRSEISQQVNAFLRS